MEASAAHDQRRSPGSAALRRPAFACLKRIWPCPVNLRYRAAMLSVIIPVFNERQTVREVIRRVCAVDVPKQIVVVDDASTDGTRQILEGLEKNAGEFLRAYPDNRLTFVYQPENRGKGAAIRAGIPRVDEAITIIQDADLE